MGGKGSEPSPCHMRGKRVRALPERRRRYRRPITVHGSEGTIVGETDDKTCWRVRLDDHTNIVTIDKRRTELLE